MLDKIDLEFGKTDNTSEKFEKINTVRQGIAQPASIVVLNESTCQKEGGFEPVRHYPMRNNTPMHEVYRKNTNNNRKPVQPIRL